MAAKRSELSIYIIKKIDRNRIRDQFAMGGIRRAVGGKARATNGKRKY
jgi:hypothetical protein